MSGGVASRIMQGLVSRLHQRGRPRPVAFRFSQARDEAGTYSDLLQDYPVIVPRGDPEIRFLQPPAQARRIYAAFTADAEARRDAARAVLAGQGLKTDDAGDWDLIGRWIERGLERNAEPWASDPGLRPDPLRPKWLAFALDLSLVFADTAADTHAMELGHPLACLNSSA